MFLGIILYIAFILFHSASRKISIATSENKTTRQCLFLNCKTVFLCFQQDNSLKLLVLQYKKNFQISIASTEGSEASGQIGSQHSFPAWNALCLRLRPPNMKQDVMQEKGVESYLLPLTVDKRGQHLVTRKKNIYFRDTFLKTWCLCAALSATST